MQRRTQIKEMLRYTSERVDDRQKPITCHELDLVPELRTSPLLHENPYPLAEVLNDLPKAAWLCSCWMLVHRDGKPKRNAAKGRDRWHGWRGTRPCWQRNCRRVASFSFVEVFDKAQRDVYKYLHRKYDTETDWYTGAEYPAGAVPAADGSTYYFPEDRVTDALTKRGFNRCLNGYIPTKSK